MIMKKLHCDWSIWPPPEIEQLVQQPFWIFGDNTESEIGIFELKWLGNKVKS